MMIRDISEKLDTLEYESMLYDFYGSLLNESQNQVMALYHEDNYSLSEIAAELGMTRQAVHYILKKAESALDGYEAKLGLLRDYIRNQEYAARAIELLNRERLSGEDAAEIREIIVKIAE